MVTDVVNQYPAVAQVIEVTTHEYVIYQGGTCFRYPSWADY